jgi:histidine ammonia-lyase
MGPTAARQAAEMLDNVVGILACEALCAAQAIDLRWRKHEHLQLGQGTAPAHQAIRQVVPFLAEDTVMYPHIEGLKRLIQAGKLALAE